MMIRKLCTVMLLAMLSPVLFGVAQAALLPGQTIGIDFANGPNTPGAGIAPNFVLFDLDDVPGPVLGVAATDVTGASTGGVTVDLASFNSTSSEGQMGETNLGFGGAGVGDYTGTVFSDLSFNDGYFFRPDAPIVLTFNGLDDALTYDIEVLPTGPVGQNRTVNFAVNGGTTVGVTYDQVRANNILAPGLIASQATNGSGQLVLTISSTTVVGIAAVAITAVPEPSSMLLLAGVTAVGAMIVRSRRAGTSR